MAKGNINAFFTSGAIDMWQADIREGIKKICVIIIDFLNRFLENITYVQLKVISRIHGT